MNKNIHLFFLLFLKKIVSLKSNQNFEKKSVFHEMLKVIFEMHF
jgi:hypothetical protein